MGATLGCGVQASHCGGFSCCGAWVSGTRASVAVVQGPSSCGSQSLERRLSSCGAWAWLLRGMWDPPRPGLEPVSRALAGGFLTTAPPGKSLDYSLNILAYSGFVIYLKVYLQLVFIALLGNIFSFTINSLGSNQLQRIKVHF